MRRLLIVFLFVTTNAFAVNFSDFFLDKTMRVNYFHTGNRGEEIIALGTIVSDGPWPGSRTRLLDPLNLGNYMLEVSDQQTKQLLYSRGFASVFGEWVTTDEAKTRAGTFEESARFPWPKKPVQMVIRKRGEDSAFHDIFTAVIEPNSRFVNAADRPPAGHVWNVIENGPPATKVDILIIGEGYTKAELPKFHRDVKRMVARLFATEPYKSRRKDFNVRALDLIEPRSGVNRPRTGDFRQTKTGVEYNIFDSERYALTLQDHRLRDIASSAPYDYLEILMNEKTYGGGGIFRDQATACVDSAFAAYIFVHEFGHHLAALADEYYTSPVAYTTTGTAEHPEPWEPNVTANGAHPKWATDPDVPLPTPWDKEEFEKHSRAIQAERARIRAANEPESVMDKLFTDERAWETKFLGSQKYAGKVGAFEGASYEPRGLYRPEADCIMFTRDEVGFCRVCRQAIERVIDEYSRP